MGQVKARRIRPPQIVQSRPERRIVLILSLLALASAGWIVLALSLTRPIQHNEMVLIEPEFKSEDLSKLEQISTQRREETEVLEHRLRTLRQEHQDEIEATREAQASIRQLQAENAELRSQLDFLTQLLGGDDGSIAISDLALSPTGDNAVRYWFKVSRTDTGEALISGEVRLEVRGQQEGETRYFGLADLTANQRSGHRLGFRNFQEIDGTMELPPDFEPEELLVIVIPDNSSTEGAQRQFDWRAQMEDD